MSTPRQTGGNNSAPSNHAGFSNQNNIHPINVAIGQVFAQILQTLSQHPGAMQQVGAAGGEAMAEMMTSFARSMASSTADAARQLAEQTVVQAGPMAANLHHSVTEAARLASEIASEQAHNLTSSSTEFVHRAASESVRAAESVHPIAGDVARSMTEFVSNTVQSFVERQMQSRSSAATSPSVVSSAGSNTVGMTPDEQQTEQQELATECTMQAQSANTVDWVGIAQMLANACHSEGAANEHLSSSTGPHDTDTISDVDASDIPGSISPSLAASELYPRASATPTPCAPAISRSAGTVILKVKMLDDLRRVTVDKNETSYMQLVELLTSMYGNISSTRITYIDVDGDSVRIASDMDFREAIEQALESSPPLLRINITPAHPNGS